MSMKTSMGCYWPLSFMVAIQHVSLLNARIKGGTRSLLYALSLRFRPSHVLKEHGKTVQWLNFNLGQVLQSTLPAPVPCIYSEGHRSTWQESCTWDHLIPEPHPGVVHNALACNQSFKGDQPLPKGHRGSPCSLNFWQGRLILFLPCFKISVECAPPVQGRSLRLKLRVKVSFFEKLLSGNTLLPAPPSRGDSKPQAVLEGQWEERGEMVNRLFRTKPLLSGSACVPQNFQNLAEHRG